MPLLLALAGCVGFVPQPVPAPERGGTYQPLTLPIVAMGDTQEHLPTGYPMHDNDSAVDAYVEVAQRPPEQPLFGRRILEWALHHPEEPFIHLGDVLDLSCRVEARRMAHIFAATRQPGTLLPGNHDGLMFGIYGYSVLEKELDPNAKRWNLACRRGAADDDTAHKTDNEAFSKRDFIAHLIGLLADGAEHRPGLERIPPHGEARVSWRNPEPDAFLSGIEARARDGFAYTDSFLAQRLQLPPAAGATRKVIVIGLDTNQAGPLVSAWDTLMGRSPGSVGHIHPDQLSAIEGWIKEAIERNDIVVFAGHHNWNSLGLPSRTLLRLLMSRLKHPLVYLSAHTHRGFWAEHRVLSQRPLLELNVSSLSDWPIAYRRISFAFDDLSQRLLVRGEILPNAGRQIESYADLAKAWEAETCGRAGVDVARIREEDLGIVREQRESRGTLLGWLLEAIPMCESCDDLLYQHAHAYQDAMLHALLQTDQDLLAALPGWPAVDLPAWCDARDFAACAKELLAERSTDFRSHVALFRRKALLVATLNDYLDRLDDPRSRAYLTCRAVLAAKIDFDLTDERSNNDRGEAKRRAEHFFRTEASVGMQ